MNIYVFSQKDIENYAKEKHDTATLLISITAHGLEKANVRANSKNNIQKILFLEFDDTDNDKDGIQRKDATRIRTFLIKNIPKYNIDTILVNCNAGQSRSAGVAAALMYYFNNDDTPIFGNYKYTPNMKCYRTVLNRIFEEDYDE